MRAIRTGIEFGEDGIAEQERDAAAALLVERDLKGLGDGVLARVVEAGQAENEALLGARRVALAQSLDDSANEWSVNCRAYSCLKDAYS